MLYIYQVIADDFRRNRKKAVFTGKGFADVCFIPRRLHQDKPAVVIELKWDKSASGALAQIKNKNYGDALKDYQGNLLLVGINYDKTTKKHVCLIEKIQK